MAAWLPGLIRPWRVVIPSLLVLLWVGFAFLPTIHPNLQMSVALALALLAGVGAELVAGVLDSSRRWAATGTYWIVPAGGALAAAWIITLSPRSWLAGFLAAAVIAALACVQSVEARGPMPARGAAHVVSIGLGFALALPAYALASSVEPVHRLAVTVVVTATLVLVVLRRPELPWQPVLGFAALATLVVAEIEMLVADKPLPPLLCGGIMLVALYAVSAASHALLDRAGPRAYVEIGVVSVGALVASLFVVPHA